MRSELLVGIRVVDLSTEIAWDCARILASYGAEVIRVDTPQDLAAMTADDRKAWQLGQRGKSCMTLDYKAAAGKAVLEGLVDKADILVESFMPGELAALGLGYAATSARNPGLVAVSLSPFGQEGPYAGYKGRELVVAAMSSLLGLCGDTDRPPVREPRNAHLFHACAAGVTGATIALWERRKSGKGQQVEVSAQEVGASRNTAWIVASQFDKRRGKRQGQYLNLGRLGRGNRTIWTLKDGTMAWQVGMPGAPATKAFAEWMTELGYPGPELIPDPPPRMWTLELREPWEKALIAFFKDRTREEVMAWSDTHRSDACAIQAPNELVDDPQFTARGYLGPPDPALPGSPRLPQYFIRTSAEVDTVVMTPTVEGAQA